MWARGIDCYCKDSNSAHTFCSSQWISLGNHCPLQFISWSIQYETEAQQKSQVPSIQWQSSSFLSQKKDNRSLLLSLLPMTALKLYCIQLGTYWTFNTELVWTFTVCYTSKFLLPFSKVHLARLVSQDNQAPILDLQVDSCSSFTVSQTENHSAHRGCQSYGLAIVCCTWKDKRKPIIKILVCIVAYNCSPAKG